MSSARLTIDLGALAHNYGVLKQAAPGAEAAPVLKADGYGLGADEIGRRLFEEGARSFFVARLVEGEALRASLAERPARIFVLDGLNGPTEAERLIGADLTPVINDMGALHAWKAVPSPARLPLALHFDTGMNRLGLAVGEAPRAAEIVSGAANLDLVLVMSHLAAAAKPDDPRNAGQLTRFAGVRAAFPATPASLAASAGTFLGPDYRFEMVRPGISLFGGGPREVPDATLRPVATLEAPVLQVREVRQGETVGYGGMFTAPRDMRVALVAAGYADGLLRRSFRQGQAAIDGKRLPLAIVSMDLIAVDVSQCAVVRPGAMVELLGPSVLLDDVAAAAETVAHECLVRLSGRAERVYLG